jgi:hypothetical protein
MPLIGNVGTTQAIYGSSTPTNDVGADEDIYVQSVDAIVLGIYKKESGVWNRIGEVNAGLQTFSPSPIQSSGGAITSASGFGFYRLLGNKLIFVRGFITVIDRGTATGFMSFSLPSSFTVVAQGGVGSCRESSVGNLCDIQFMPNLTSARVNKYDGTTVFTANNVFYTFSGIYEFL